MANNPIFVKGTLAGVDVETGQKTRQTRQETAWVIEGKDGYFIGAHFAAYGYGGKRDSSLAWRHGHENALRFARREDAEIIRGICETQGIQFDPDAHGVNEHSWG